VQELDERQMVPAQGKSLFLFSLFFFFPSIRFDHIQMLLRLLPERERAAEAFVDALRRRGSHVISMDRRAEFGRRFGALFPPPLSPLLSLFFFFFSFFPSPPFPMMIDFSACRAGVDALFSYPYKQVQKEAARCTWQ